MTFWVISQERLGLEVLRGARNLVENVNVAIVFVGLTKARSAATDPRNRSSVLVS